ncbi:hypothetical protein SLEP1_g28138 [Rubroshorea leprosula]|uniref:Uncharacterized protein n=1 Tax=Rubroshorea leprosula TaxID=152421 RepID=A0AAV5JVC1_9ROSI|nr:hypothetical protein SLEP1_g28138 [Rubroshorea leprosula]
MPAPADDHTLLRSPIGGSQPIGFDCRTGPPHESCNTKVVISKMREEMREEMQELFRLMQYNIAPMIQKEVAPMIQKEVAAALAQSVPCPETNAPIVSPSGPHHNTLGNIERTDAVAGSSGGPITQSSPQNEENDGTNKFLFVDGFFNFSDPGPETGTGDLADIVRDYCSPALHGLRH